MLCLKKVPLSNFRYKQSLLCPSQGPKGPSQIGDRKDNIIDLIIDCLKGHFQKIDVAHECHKIIKNQLFLNYTITESDHSVTTA